MLTNIQCSVLKRETKLLVWGKNIKGEQSLKSLEPGGSGSSRHEAASPAGDLCLLLTIDKWQVTIVPPPGRQKQPIANLASLTCKQTKKQNYRQINKFTKKQTSKQIHTNKWTNNQTANRIIAFSPGGGGRRHAADDDRGDGGDLLCALSRNWW